MSHAFRRGCLVAVAIVGGLVALNWPCTASAIQRSKQKRSMALLRQVGSAVDSFALEHGAPPRTGTIDALARRLVPRYAPEVPRQDGWGRPIRYRRIVGASVGYAIESAGKDGAWDRTGPGLPAEGLTKYFDCDIVFANGAFVRSPEGIQRS